MTIQALWKVTLSHWVIPDVSKEHSALIQESNSLGRRFLLDRMTPEDQGITLLQNTGNYSSNDTVSLLRRHES